MLSLLRSIVNTILLLVTFVIHLIESLINFILMIPTYVTFISSMISVVPAFATVFFTGGIALTVILFIIGKQQEG